MVKSEPEKSWHVYILINEKAVTYTGITYDVDATRRIDQHNSGKGAKFTRGKGPWKLLYIESNFPGRAQAQSRERAIKADHNFKRQLKNNDHPLPMTSP